jgi:hypothetical protein
LKFAYFLQNDKWKLIVLTTLALLGDLLWLFYWVPHWHSDEMAKWQSGLHNFVILCVVALLLLKVVIVPTLLTVSSSDMRNAQ